MRRFPILFLLICLTLLLATLGVDPARAGEPLPVFTSVLPLKYFVERVGGERVAVQVMVGPGRSPATYEPRPRQMAVLARTRLYYRVGVPFESVWMERISALNPAMEIVDLREGLTLRPLAEHHHEEEERLAEAAGHDHEPAQDHDHEFVAEEEELDPHVWTDPNLVRQMAEHIRVTLSAADPAGADVYQANCQSFVRDLEELDRSIRQQLAGLQNRRFLVFHPSWGYFAAAYGLEQVAIEAAGKEPGPRALAGIIEQARREKIRVIFVQQQFSQATAATIARAIDGKVVAIDPLAANYLANMRHTARALVQSLEGTP